MAGRRQAADRHSRLKIAGFRNTLERGKTIRVDSKVVSETDSDRGERSDEQRGCGSNSTPWVAGLAARSLGRPVYPEGFEELAEKLERSLHPPGRDVRCIVTVGMLTEGWDCNTVTHIVGLRPFMSQLLCEQVVGRALRRMDYELKPKGSSTKRWPRCSACRSR